MSQRDITNSHVTDQFYLVVNRATGGKSNTGHA